MLDLDPFHVEYIAVAHSIPEANALAIRTPLGTALHTGDWKIDPEPGVGNRIDEARLRALGDEGVDVLICDSTNILREGDSFSESDVARVLRPLIAEATGRVLITTFASNVARLRAIARSRAGLRAHRRRRRPRDGSRRAGRARMRLSRRPAGIPFAGNAGRILPRDKTVVIATGSQGETRAAMMRASINDHPAIKVVRGRSRDLLLAHHSRQCARGPSRHQQSLQPRRRGHYRSRSPRALLRPSASRRSRANVRLGAAEERRAGAWRGASSHRSMWPLPRRAASSMSCRRATATWCNWRRRAGVHHR